MKRAVAIAACLIAAATCASARGDAPAPMDMSPPHVAHAHHPVGTSVPQAQAFFDQGLTLLYSFNREAAQRAFEQAAKADPKLAMAQWGIAMSLGPNINVPIDAKGEALAFAALQRARALAPKASAEDRAYISALSARYSNAAAPDFDALALAYKNTMAQLVDRYPDDLDAATLYAEAMMDLRPWALFTVDGNPEPGTQDIVSTLESAMRRDPQHIGANHFYIHTVEASRSPERALIAARRLDAMEFEPAAAHLVHMPAHVYMRTGDYAAATRANERATTHDRTFLHAAMDPEAFGYYGHNLAMLTTGYAMEGDFSDAQRTAAVLVQQGSYIQQLFVLMRFDRWHDILDMPEPKSAVDGPLLAPFWRFARGLAYAAGGDVASAQRELDAVDAAQAAVHVPASAGNYNSSHDLLSVAHAVLSARIAQAKGDDGSGIERFRAATATQDKFHYTEPPDWYMPERESLGGALLRQGSYVDAEVVFRDDLRRNPRNPRSLFGLAAALRGQHKTDDAALVDAQFTAAWGHSDTKLSIAGL